MGSTTFMPSAGQVASKFLRQAAVECDARLFYRESRMRLLDLVAQYRKPFVILPPGKMAQPIAVSGPCDFAPRVAGCPLRFVIDDNLTRASAELAFADGDRLAACLDLLRIPAPLLWIEWSDAVHQQVIQQCGITERDPHAAGRQVGVLLEATPSGRAGVARTFWSIGAAGGAIDVLMSPLETHIDLDENFETGIDVVKMLGGGYGSVHCADRSVAELLQRVRFKFDLSWSRYYGDTALDAECRDRVVRASLAAVAHDIPMLLAFFLLLHAKGATRPVAIDRAPLNRKRLAKERAPLLDHVEVHASLPEMSSPHVADDAAGWSASRRPPRLHHVRGHLVRREDRIFWRTPHLRGSAHQGVVRSRTVCLSFAAARA
jgi:hypothetical protein